VTVLLGLRHHAGGGDAFVVGMRMEADEGSHGEGTLSASMRP
jgi:hypothetical protein